MEIDDKYRHPIDLFQEIVLENREIVYCCGYPRSGTTWLTRLLAECLNSPALSWGIKNDVRKPRHRDPAVEGLSRRGDYIVRHGHWKKAERDTTKEKVVVIHRDPRDVAVSCYHYFNFHGGDMCKVVDQMVGKKGKGLSFVNVHGRGWAGYVSDWLNDGVVYVKYEDLIAQPLQVVADILNRLDLPVLIPGVQEAIGHHTFDKRQKDKTMRRGVAGGWMSELPRELAHQLEALCKPEMRRLGYLG